MKSGTKCWKNCIYVNNFFVLLHLIILPGFLSRNERITRHQGKREAIPLTLLYHFHLLHRHYNQVVATDNSHLHIASDHWLLSSGNKYSSWYTLACGIFLGSTIFLGNMYYLVKPLYWNKRKQLLKGDPLNSCF